MSLDEQITALQVILDETLAFATEGRRDDALLCLVTGLARAREACPRYVTPGHGTEPELPVSDGSASGAMLPDTVAVRLQGAQLSSASQSSQEQEGPASRTEIAREAAKGRTALVRFFRLKFRGDKSRAPV